MVDELHPTDGDCVSAINMVHKQSPEAERGWSLAHDFLYAQSYDGIGCSSSFLFIIFILWAGKPIFSTRRVFARSH